MVSNVKKGYMETRLDFDERYFYLAEDCVGTDVHFSFRGNHYIICLPNFDFTNQDDLGDPLPTAKDTKIKLNWLSHKKLDDIDYGRIFSHNPITKTVKGFSCNQLIVRSRGLVSTSQARAAKVDLPVWKELFADWLEITLFIDMAYTGVEVTQADNIQAYFIPKNRSKNTRRIKTKAQQNTAITITMRDGLSKKALVRALKLASGDEKPPGYYKQAVNAMKHLHNHNYRQCVLDTATAFEMAMTQILETKLKNLTEAERGLIINKYTQIMGLWEGLKKLGVTMPSKADMQSKIAEPRNAAIHRGEIVTQKQAQESLEFMKSFVYSRLPIK